VFETGAERLEILRGVDWKCSGASWWPYSGHRAPANQRCCTCSARWTGYQGPGVPDSLDVFSYPESKLHELRNRKVGFVFQFHHLLSEFTVLENVAMPLLVRVWHGPKRWTGRTRCWRRSVRLPPDSQAGRALGRRAGARCHGRALVNDPAVILADEPTGNLDTTSAAALVDLMVRLSNERKMTILVVTHNRRLLTVRLAGCIWPKEDSVRI